MPIILFKYIARKNIIYLFALLMATAVVMFVFDSMELARLSHNRIGAEMIIQLALLKNYCHLSKVFPFVFILSTILTYASLTKSLELIVARSYGMSAWQFIMPSASVALVFGLINLLLLNPVGSSMLARYEHLEALHLKGRSSTVALSNNGLWLKEETSEHNIFIHALRISQATHELFDAEYFVTDREYRPLTTIYADVAHLISGQKWELKGVRRTSTEYGFENMHSYSIPTKMNFLQIQESLVSPDTISIYRLPSFIAATQDSGFHILRHIAYLYQMLASPFFYVSMVLIGTVFATKSPRSGRLGLSMFFGTMVGFAIYFLSDIMVAIALAGSVPIGLAALAPTIVCMSIGLYLVLHYEDG